MVEKGKYTFNEAELKYLEILTLSQEGKNNRLIRASDRGDLEQVKTLVKVGADIEARNQYKTTPLITASWQGHVEIVKFLLEAGADVTPKNNRELTALDHAKNSLDYTKRSQHAEIIKLLEN